MDRIPNPALDSLHAGKLSLGIGLRIVRGVEIARLLKAAGYDFMFIDLEHGTMPLDLAAQVATAGLDAGISGVVRVPRGQYAMATRLLDNGASGIVIPHVDTADEAREIVSALKYPPIGHRSIGPVPQTLGLSLDRATTGRLVNASTLIAVMLESPEAIENAEAIAAVEGIDVLMIGTSDLTAEMGIPGAFSDPAVVAAYERLIAACARHGKFPGMGGIYDEPVMRRYIELGARFILSGADQSFIAEGSARRSGFLRSIAIG